MKRGAYKVDIVRRLTVEKKLMDGVEKKDKKKKKSTSSQTTCFIIYFKEMHI